MLLKESFVLQRTKDQKTLSFIEILTRNLFLFTVMCIFIALGITIRLLDVESLDTYWLQIKSNRLEFLFFIGVAACYIPLLFILLQRYWINFFTQLACSIVLFIVLLFIFAPPLTIKSYFFDHDIEFSTRSWGNMNGLYVGRIVKENEASKLSLNNIQQPTSYHYCLLSFVFSYYPDPPTGSDHVHDKELEKVLL